MLTRQDQLNTGTGLIIVSGQITCKCNYENFVFWVKFKQFLWFIKKIQTFSLMEPSLLPRKILEQRKALMTCSCFYQIALISYKWKNRTLRNNMSTLEKKNISNYYIIFFHYNDVTSTSKSTFYSYYNEYKRSVYIMEIRQVGTFVIL